MRRAPVLATMPLLLAACGSDIATACERIQSCDLSKYMTKSQFAEFKRTLVQAKQKQAIRIADSNPREVESPVLGGFQTRTIPPRPPGTKPPPSDTSLMFLLRKDFADVSLLSAPTPTAKASGAEFSYTRDNVAKDTTFAGTGLVAVAYSYLNGDIHDPFIGVTVAPYVSFNRELHSNKVSNNVDTKTLGISGEVGFQNAVFDGSDYVRGRAAAVSDDILGSTNVSTTVEWLPTYAWVAGSVPGTYLNFNFMPEMKLQYDNTTAAGKTMRFSGQSEALRIGPEVNLQYRFYGPDGAAYDLLRRFSGNLTYHWWSELYSGRSESWFNTSLTYNLDEEGHIGLTTSYKRGSDENTGAAFDLYKVTLSAKLCTELFSKTSC
jgi:hypothetical protein